MDLTLVFPQGKKRRSRLCVNLSMTSEMNNFPYSQACELFSLCFGKWPKLIKDFNLLKASSICHLQRYRSSISSRLKSSSVKVVKRITNSANRIVDSLTSLWSLDFCINFFFAFSAAALLFLTTPNLPGIKAPESVLTKTFFPDLDKNNWSYLALIVIAFYYLTTHYMKWADVAISRIRVLLELGTS